jgi:hypothetical protein
MNNFPVHPTDPIRTGQNIIITDLIHETAYPKSIVKVKANRFHARLFWHLFEFQVSSSHCVRIIGEHGADETFSSIKNYCSTSTKAADSDSLSAVSAGYLIELQVRDEPYWRSIKAVVPTLLGGGALLSPLGPKTMDTQKGLLDCSVKVLRAAALTRHVMTLMTPARGG